MTRKKKPPTRSVTVRMPLPRYELLAMVCDMRHLDLSSLLNSLIADNEPGLRRWVAEYRVGDGPEQFAQRYLDLLPPERREAVAAWVAKLQASDEAWTELDRHMRKTGDVETAADARAVMRILGAKR